ncbi:MAG: alpha/beta hydrolase [Actinomycetes bacterium]
MTYDRSDLLVEGPWEHREISANGLRFHAASSGDGPLVLMLHGFPENWWAWRHQLVSFADAGYRVVALDLRGYGATDHTPRGYDTPSLTADVAAVIRSLGSDHAHVVGHDWGGAIGWTLAAVHPQLVTSLVVVSAPHPRRLRSAVLRRPAQLAASAQSLVFQSPWAPERMLVKDDARRVDELLHRWSAPGWPDAATSTFYRQAMQVGNTAYCAMEYYRWAVRSAPRPDGIRYASAMRSPIKAPVLQVHGDQDRWLLPASAQGSDQYVTGPYEWRLLDGVGHFPHEEAPDRFDTEVLKWLDVADSAHGFSD